MEFNKDSREGIGVVIKGEDPTRDLTFVIAFGITADDYEITFQTAAASPTNDVRTQISPEEAPQSVRSHILNIRQQMIDSKRTFYNKEIDELTEQYIQNITDEFDDFFELEKDQLEAKLHSKFLDIRPNSEPDVFVTDLNELTFNESSPDSNGSRETTESDTSSESEDLSVLEITPVIDVQSGKKIESLDPGTTIAVKLAGRSAKTFGSFQQSPGKNESPTLPAELLSYKKIESDDNENLLRVRLQEGILGEGNVPQGSMVKCLNQNTVKTRESEYEEQLYSLLFIIASLLILFLIFGYFIIL